MMVLHDVALRRQARLPGQVAGLLLLVSCLLLLLGACIGSTGIESLFDMRNDPVALQIVRDIRAPRAIGAWLTQYTFEQFFKA